MNVRGPWDLQFQETESLFSPRNLLYHAQKLGMTGPNAQRHVLHCALLKVVRSKKLFYSFLIRHIFSVPFICAHQDEAEDRDNFLIKPNDNLIVAGHVDQDFSVLEISGEV